MAETKVAEARDEIVKLLLALSEEERTDCFAEVRYNGIFCCACGFGSSEAPNANCQCENDT